VVSTSSNEILWVAPDGSVSRRWKAPGNGDAWHLNGLVQADGELFVSAFGQYDRHREWSERIEERTGFIYNLHTRRPVVSNLCHPHSPRRINDSWLVCNSIRSELAELDYSTGKVRRVLTLQGYTRGLALTGNLIFVGESANRRACSGQSTASIAIVDRKAWQVVERINLPPREVYDLALVSAALCDGLKRGFRTNTTRVSEQDQLSMFDQVGIRPARLWAVAGPLPLEDIKVKITAEIPTRMSASELAIIRCTIENLSSEFFVSAPPCPVNISYRWVKDDNRVSDIEGLRTRLPEPIAPLQRLTCAVQVQAPESPGQYQLFITLVQEQVAWFCDLDSGNASTGIVAVS
jgi:hypothetical protein